MLRKMKKLPAVLLCVCLLLVLTACNGAETKETSSSSEQTIPAGEVKITDGIYVWDNSEVTMKTFLRFNEDGTYYGYYFDGGVMEAGTYEILDEEFSYAAADGTSAAASQVIVTTSYQGTEQKWGFADDKLVDGSLGGMATHCTMVHDADYAYDPAVDEKPIVICVYYADNDAGASLTLYHDRTFVDYTGDTGDEGTWEINGGGYTLTGKDGGTYTLTPSDAAASYDKGNGAIELTDAIVNNDVMLTNTFSAEGVQVGLPMEVDVRIECFSDCTCRVLVYVEQVDADLEVDSGTYTVTDVFNYAFSFEKAGEIAGEPDFSSATADGINVSVPYKADVTADFMDAETPMSIDTALMGVATEAAVPTGSAAVELINTFIAEDAQVGLPMGVDVRIECYSDGACKVLVYVEQVETDLEVDSGTYTVADVFNYAFSFEKAGEIAGEPDFTTATETGVGVNVPYKADVTADFMGTETPLSIDLVLIGTATLD